MKVGLSRSSIYVAIAEKRFPQPVHLGARAVGWLESEVDEWLNGQIQLSRS
jgi:prophage regulatory protein